MSQGFEFQEISNIDRDSLLKLVDDVPSRTVIKEIKGTRFFMALATQLLKEIYLGAIVPDLSDDDPESLRLAEKFKKIGELCDNSLESLEKCESYAHFLFYLQLPVWIGEDSIPKEWIVKATKLYPDSIFLRYLLAYLTISPYLEEPISLENEIDSVEIIINCLRKDPELILDSLGLHQQVTLDILKFSEDIVKDVNSKLITDIFPSVPLKSTINAITSLANARLAKFYLIANKLDEHKAKVIESVNQFKDNSFAITQQAYLLLDKKDLRKSEKMLKSAFNSIQEQFDGIKELKNRIIYDILLGLGYIYYEKGQYEEAEKKYNEALEIENVSYFKSLAILNRGRVRIETEDLLDAIEDFSVAKNEPLLRAAAHTNLGIVYQKQGLYGKAEDEFNAALELNPDLPHSYHNLAVLHNEQGDKNRAKRLLGTSISIDKNFPQSREALRKLEGSELRSVGEDWLNWWFGKRSSKVKKIIGSGIVVLTGILVLRAGYLSYYGLDVSTTLFAVLAVNILILLLPIISKLKIGPVELEVESKGESPAIIQAYAVGYLKGEKTLGIGLQLLSFDFILY